MRRLYRDLAPVLGFLAQGRRRMLWLGAVLAGMTALASMVLLGVSGWFITATAIAGLSTATALAFEVFMPAATIRLMAVLRTASRYGERVITHDATLAALARLRERLFRAWAEPGAAGRLALRPSRLLFRLTADIDALDGIYLRLLVPLAASFATACLGGVILAFLSVPLALAVFALVLAVGYGLPLWAARRAGPLVLRRALLIERLRARVIDLSRGQTEFLMTGQIGAQQARIAATEAALARCDARLNRIETTLALGLKLLGAALLAGVLLAAASLVQTGRITAPGAALALLLVLALTEPFQALGRGGMELARSRLAARRLRDGLAAPASRAAAAAPPAGLAVRLTDVSLRHPGARADSLRGVSLSLGATEHIALIGESGAGKSSLIALIAGEIAPGRSGIEALPAALLTQSSQLFADSLRGNLALARPDASDARMRAALAEAGLDPLLAALPQGLDTPLAEAGLGLSGGQGRRLALARLILRDAPLWLLDEPSDGLDGPTARDILARLERLTAARARITATHLRREAESADRLILIKEGAVAAIYERGSAGFREALNGLRPD
ncbi:MAG: ATP-binding cassette domain-containing protein [Paracoccus sp. (in: a-proteobacteria)]|uniref:amino acid ABC transporter ATP-binding/permease protein n=1 Tax=Paracoccus sp. TaxID=267 RepID=UPI0039E42790